jgi:NTE family protein
MSPTARALVLGGGGITGIAWELGVLAGLAEKGIDILSPDLVVGTSAGSVVGAQILSGESIEVLYASQLADPTGEAGARMGAGALARFVIASAWPGDPGRGRAYLGRAAVGARTNPESDSRAAFERLVPRDSWPERRLVVTAVDAGTGEPRFFDRDSGVELRDAVAASCAVPIVWPPITIQGHRYIDGGVRSIANADLAAGCDRVVVIAPVTFALRRSGRISAQLASLGPDVRSLVVSPDAQARAAIGRNVLDPAQRVASARAGRRQAAGIAFAVQSVWSAR